VVSREESGYDGGFVVMFFELGAGRVFFELGAGRVHFILAKFGIPDRVAIQFRDRIFFIFARSSIRQQICTAGPIFIPR